MDALSNLRFTLAFAHCIMEIACSKDTGFEANDAPDVSFLQQSLVADQISLLSREWRWGAWILRLIPCTVQWPSNMPHTSVMKYLWFSCLCCCCCLKEHFRCIFMSVLLCVPQLCRAVGLVHEGSRVSFFYVARCHRRHQTRQALSHPHSQARWGGPTFCCPDCCSYVNMYKIGSVLT